MYLYIRYTVDRAVTSVRPGGRPPPDKILAL